MADHDSNEGPDLGELDALTLAAKADEDYRGEGGEYIPGGEPPPGGDAGPDRQTVEIVATLSTTVFAIVAARRGAHWALSEAEAQALAEPAAECLEKYLPGLAVGPEVGLALAAAMIALPRLQQDAVRAQQEAEREAAARRAGSGEGGGDGAH